MKVSEKLTNFKESKMQKGLFKCSRQKIKRLVKDLVEDAEMLDLSKIQLIDKIRKLKEKNKKLKEKIKNLDTGRAYSKFRMN